MSELNALNFVRRNAHNFIVSKRPGIEIAFKLAESAAVDGATRVSVYSRGHTHKVCANFDWIKTSAFESLTPYPELAVNSSRAEILVAAFSEWFIVLNNKSVVHMGGELEQSIIEALIRAEDTEQFTVVFEMKNYE